MTGIASVLIAAGGNVAGVFLIDATPYSIGSSVRTTTFRVSSDGYIYHGDNGVYTTQYLWLKQGANTDFEIYCTVTDGSVSGTTGSWLGLGTTRDWSVTDPLLDGTDATGVIVLQIRRVSTGIVEASATITMTSQRI